MKLFPLSFIEKWKKTAGLCVVDEMFIETPLL